MCAARMWMWDVRILLDLFFLSFSSLPLELTCKSCAVPLFPFFIGDGSELVTADWLRAFISTALRVLLLSFRRALHLLGAWCP